MALLASASTLSACSIKEQPYAALFLQDGTPTVVIAGCDSDSLRVVLRQTEGPAAPTAATGASSEPVEPVFWEFEKASPARLEEIKLLNGPSTSGVGNSTGNSGSALFRADSRYQLSGSVTIDVVPVNFTMKDLTGLNQDQVFGPGDKPLSRKDFEKRATDACDASGFG